MVDRDRVLAKLDEVHGYLAELRAIAPATIDEYARPLVKRACERLLQVSLESVFDVCALLVAGLRLGLPGEEDDLFAKLVTHGVLSTSMLDTLRRMRGLRNLLVHEYGRIDDATLFETIRDRLGDVEAFTREVLAHLRTSSPGSAG